ncbi:MAG: glutamate 5-kinase [Armatimonadetes bacterium]|nr:glutamate 5-kinase [Armatimonadota bacterium]
MDEERRARDQLAKARRIVVKVGTRIVAAREGGVNRAFLNDLAGQVAQLRQRGVETVLVTSGAVHLGRRALAHVGRGSVSARQAMAAIGQPELMLHYAEAFAPHGLIPAQLLLTAEDMTHRERYLNVRNTLETLLRQGAVPVINENDSVSIEGITFGENDRLAALVAIKVRADALVFLSDQPGLLTGDPRQDANARLVPAVLPGQDLSGCAGGTGGTESAGGMSAKLEAARMAAECGIVVVIGDGREPGVVVRLLDGERLGTVFVPGPPMEARKAWLATTAEPSGELVVDEGAKRALLAEDGASLLPVGVREVRGDFSRGDVVIVRGPEGEELARGLVSYSAEELRRIAGHRTRDVERILGRRGDDEAVHRDNMVVTAPHQPQRAT